MPGKEMMPPPEALEERADAEKRAEQQKEIERRIEALAKHHQQQQPKGTAVDGPKHYNGYEVLDAICNAGFGRGFCLGNAVKYLLRSAKKGKDQEDLEKAQFYLNWYLERYERYEGKDGKVQGQAGSE